MKIQVIIKCKIGDKNNINIWKISKKTIKFKIINKLII